MLAIVEVNAYGVVAIVVALGALWIAAMVYHETHEIITITTRSDVLGHKGWYLKGTKICLGSASGDAKSILITTGNSEQLLPPGVWSEADRAFLSMVRGHTLRGRHRGERVVLVPRKRLPEKALEYIDNHKKSAYSWT